MTAAELVRFEPTGDAPVDRAVMWWRDKPTLPPCYIGSDGAIDFEGMTLAAIVLNRLEVDPQANLGDTFVIRSGGGMSLGFKADLQRYLARRHGFDVILDEIDDDHVVAHIVTPTGPKPPITKRLTDKDLTAYAKRNAANYNEKPRRMLEARVSTELIDFYAKEVLRHAAAVVNQAGAAYVADDGSGPAAIGEGRPGPETRDDGSTIPEPLRQPVCPDGLRDSLLARLAVLEARAPERVARMREQLAPARIPNPRAQGESRRSEFKLAHGWLLDRVFADLEAELDAEAVADTAEGGTGDDVDDDPGRPFE